MSSTKELSLASGQKVLIPKKLYNLEPAHVSRYQIIVNLLKQITKGTESPKILDVGGKKGLLREFGVMSTIIDMENSDEDNYVQGDALAMPFSDNSFDAVVSCDVLEHIPEKSREKFISELLRVSKGYVVFCAPFDSNGVSESEKSANEFYKKLSNKDHRWLIEHIENDLPKQSQIDGYLNKHGINYDSFRHFSLEIWDITTRIHMINSIFGDSEATGKIALSSYKEYYDKISEYDFCENGYRTFYILNKNHKFKLELPNLEKHKTDTKDYQEYLNRILIVCIEELLIERKKRSIVMRKTIKNKDVHIQNLEAKIAMQEKTINKIKQLPGYGFAKSMFRRKA